MHDPRTIAPVKAKPKDEEVGENWIVGFGNSMVDGEDWCLVTDSVRASQLLDADFPVDAKIDAEFLADLINAYRDGRLVLKDQPRPGVNSEE